MEEGDGGTGVLYEMRSQKRVVGTDLNKVWAWVPEQREGSEADALHTEEPASYPQRLCFQESPQ